MQILKLDCKKLAFFSINWRFMKNHLANISHILYCLKAQKNCSTP